MWDKLDKIIHKIYEKNRKSIERKWNWIKRIVIDRHPNNGGYFYFGKTYKRTKIEL